MITLKHDEAWAFELEWVPDPLTGRLAYHFRAEDSDADVVDLMRQEGGVTQEEPQSFLEPVLCVSVVRSGIRKARSWLPLFLCVSIPAVSESSVLHVSPTGNGVPPFATWVDASPTIQPAIDASNDLDTILVASATYSSIDNRDLDFQGNGVALIGVSGPEQTIIDCQGSNVDPHRAFYFHTGEDSGAVVKGFTIRGGYAPGDLGLELSRGGGVLCEAASPQFIDCVFEGNLALNGGGALACVNGASPRVYRCQFRDNLADNDSPAPIAGYGGAIRCIASAPAITGCSFTNNRANIGGAISCNQSDIRIDSCRFNGNSAITHNTFEPYSNGFGGAIHYFQSSPELSFSIFAANKAEPVSELFYRPGQGGAIYAYLADANISNCTFYGNAAEKAPGYSQGEGGGIFVAASSPTIEACVIASSTDGEALHCYDSASHPTLLCSDLFNNAGGDWVGCILAQGQTDGNFSLDPQFCSVTDSTFSLNDESPCLAANSQCGLLVGATGVGCTGTEVGDNENSILSDQIAVRSFPNPFNTATVIEFQMNRTDELRMEIVDILGRSHGVFANGLFHPGTYTVRWDGRSTRGFDLPTGVYFCRVQSGSDQSTIQLVLLR